MSEDVRIDNLNDSGRFLFIYSDKYNVYLFFWSKSKKLYKVTTDKSLYIESADEIETPDEFSNFTDIKFFKPYTTNNTDHTFIGIVTIDGVSSKFSIENQQLVYTEEITYVNTNKFNSLNSLSGIEVVAHIQKKNKLFLVGIDINEDGYEPIYGVVDLEKDQFQQLYYLYSDKGEINLTTVNIDVDELKVYVGGHTDVLDHNNQIEDVKPFIETFLLRK